MTKEDLINIAKNAKKNAFVKLTDYKVGAALLASSGTVYIGTNVDEPAIPGLSNCAERVAIQNALAHGERSFEAIAVVGGKEDNIDDTLIPCGTCLQYILDICSNVDIITYIDGNIVTKKVKEYLSFPYEYK